MSEVGPFHESGYIAVGVYDDDSALTLMQEADIPDFIRASPYLLSLLVNEELSVGIKVPRNSLKQTTKINNKKDLFELLHTMRYWMLSDETLYKSSNFLQ